MGVKVGKILSKNVLDQLEKLRTSNRNDENFEQAMRRAEESSHFQIRQNADGWCDLCQKKYDIFWRRNEIPSLEHTRKANNKLGGTLTTELRLKEYKHIEEHHLSSHQSDGDNHRQFRSKIRYNY
jgi:hypothetical protein